MTHDDRARTPFTSKRERLLWLGSLGVAGAIFIGLWLAPVLASVLRHRALLDVAFGIALLLVVATVLTLATKARPGGIEIGLALGLGAICLLVLVRTALPPAERTHLIEYAVLAALVYEALLERASRGRHVPAPGLLAIALASLMGLADECLQALLPARVFDPLDLAFNVIAATAAVAASALIHWAHTRAAST